MISAIVGVLLTMNIAGNRLLGIGIGFSALINMLLPLFIILGTSFTIAMTGVQALFEGLTYPSLFVILKYWAPPSECSMLLSIVLFGDYLGRSTGLIISFYTLKWIDFWMSCFLIYGSFGLIWLPFWIMFSCEKPELDYKIRTKEFDHILMSIKESDKQSVKIDDIPWISMITSLPFIGLIIVSFCISWNSVIVYKIAQFYIISLTTRRGITPSEGLLIFMIAILVIAGGVIMDILKYKYPTTILRKVFTCGGLLITGIICGWVFNCQNNVLRFTLLTGFCILHGVSLIGYMVNQIDISPRFVSITVGICSAVRSFAVIVMECIYDNSLKSVFVDYYLKDEYGYVNVPDSKLMENHKETWIFAVTAGVNVVGSLLFAIFASGENQNWKTDKFINQNRNSTSVKNTSEEP
ncbi:hypothetical protein CHUAL_000019 [Chamberlinius hualienensis]